MNRPTRQQQHLQEKVATKESRGAKRKPGSKTKRWRKWIALYAPRTTEQTTTG